jgi:hypothetical protein
LDQQLIYGGYPYIWSLALPQEKKEYLKKITTDYLYRDALDLTDIHHPEMLSKLATLLSFQIGSQVSYNELSLSLGIDIKTVKRYLLLLQESFVIFELPSYARNLRSELVKSKKYYFWDLGIRNALIDGFQPLDSRTDVGFLWENFLAIERMKYHEYKKTLTTCFFWRTKEQNEIDWIELHDGALSAFEFKWSAIRSQHTPKSFIDTYQTRVSYITRDNYLPFISVK